MNAFEQIVAKLPTKEGYWTQLDYKVNLPKEQKRKMLFCRTVHLLSIQQKHKKWNKDCY